MCLAEAVRAFPRARPSLASCTRELHKIADTATDDLPDFELDAIGDRLSKPLMIGAAIVLGAIVI